MKQFIEVNGIQLYAFHGCLEEEGKIGGHYLVHIRLQTDFTKAALTDDLNLTIDYVQINAIAKEEMAIRSKLIETVGWRILQRIKNEHPTVTAVEVKIEKNTPPINGDVKNVAIILQEGNWD